MKLTKKKIGLVLGPIVFTSIILFFHPVGLVPPANAVLATAAWVAIWWITEALPIAVTALLPIVLFPLSGGLGLKETTASYGHKFIFLFLGGFILAIAIEKWNLHKRIALFVLNNAGSNGASLILGFMVTAAVISMWVMNTATTIMLLPIGLAVITVVKETVKGLSEKETENFQLALLLGIAYGATIGGMSTLIGTGPNGMLAAFMADNYGLDISFVDWMKVGVPLSAVMLPCSWLILTRIIFKVKFETSTETIALLSDMKEELGSLRGPEYKVLLVFILTAAAWMFRTLIDNISFLEGLSDAGIAMIASLALFLVPSGDKEKKGGLLEWQDAQENVPWGLLVLFGGGLSLANAVQTTGLAIWMGNLLPEGINLVLLVVLVVTMILFLTELTSNLATTATFLPVVAAVAIQSDFNPILLTAAVGLAASCAFMLPVATPPNAIVFGSGLIRVPQMARAGFLINILGIIIVSFVAVVSVPYFLL